MTPAEQLQAAIAQWADLLGNYSQAERWAALEHLAKRCDEARRDAQAVMEAFTWDLLAVCVLARGDGLVVRVPAAAFLTVVKDAERWAQTRAMEAAAGLPMGALGAEEG